MIDAKLSSSTHPVILSNVSPQSLLTNALAERVSSGTCNDDCGDTPNQQEPDDPNDAAPDLHSDTACGLTSKLRHRRRKASYDEANNLSNIKTHTKLEGQRLLPAAPC
jgi:hypothetical protein